MVARNSLLQNIENADKNSQTSQDDLDLEPIPKKRMRIRLAWILILGLVPTILILVYGFTEKSVFEYKQVRDPTTTILEAIKNGSIIIYTRDEKETYPVFLNLGLGLLGIILGTFLDRVFLVFEELCYFKSRYNRSVVKLLKACFSGISWPAVLVIFVLAAISVIVVVTKTSFKLGYLIYISGGIGVNLLVIHLLNLNTLSEVDVSRFLEERRLYPANIIAWYYYFQNLRKVLPIFDKSFTKSGTLVQDQGTGQTSSDETVQPGVQLSLKKVILLISHDCITKDNLNELDNHITKITVIRNKAGYDFPVYSLRSKKEKNQYVVLNAKEPLETLQEMSKPERIKAIHENQREHQVKLLCRTLESEILTEPLDQECRDMCIVVPIMAEKASSLQNGGLVKLIMTVIKAHETNSTKKHSSSSSKNGTPHKGKQENPDHAGSRAQCTRKEDSETDNRDRPEYASLPTGNSKEADNGRLQRKYKKKSKQSGVQIYAPNDEQASSILPEKAVKKNSDIYKKKEKNISSGFVNEQENGPSGKEEKDIPPYSTRSPPYSSHISPRSDHTRDTKNQAKCGRMDNYQR